MVSAQRSPPPPPEGGGGVRIVPGNPVKAREIFKRGYDELKTRGEVEPVSLHPSSSSFLPSSFLPLFRSFFRYGLTAKLGGYTKH
jgi:hypothetical protein